MNPAHVHLLFNHFPVVTSFLGLLLLLFARLRNSDELNQATLGVFVLGAVLAAPAYFSGEPAEYRVEGLAGVSEPRIEDHEEAAKAAAVAVGVLGALSAAGLIQSFRRWRPPRVLGAAIAVVAIITALLMGRAARLGGQIHHPEIREPAASAPDAREGRN